MTQSERPSQNRQVQAELVFIKLSLHAWPGDIPFCHGKFPTTIVQMGTLRLRVPQVRENPGAKAAAQHRASRGHEYLRGLHMGLPLISQNLPSPNCCRAHGLVDLILCRVFSRGSSTIRWLMRLHRKASQQTMVVTKELDHREGRGWEELITTSLSTRKPRGKSNKNYIQLLPAKTQIDGKGRKTSVFHFAQISNCHTLFTVGKCQRSLRKGSQWLAAMGPLLGSGKIHSQQWGWPDGIVGWNFIYN